MDGYVTTVIKQIGLAKNNEEVEKIIQQAIASLEEGKKDEFTVERCMNKLSKAIQNQHPLECSSSQWGYYRYALICIGEASVINA